VGCLRRGTRVHFVPGSMATVTFDLGPARSRSAAYHFHPFAGGQQTMSILLDALRGKLFTLCARRGEGFCANNARLPKRWANRIVLAGNARGGESLVSNSPPPACGIPVVERSAGQAGRARPFGDQPSRLKRSILLVNSANLRTTG
jgi:hypothetical protein